MTCPPRKQDIPRPEDVLVYAYPAGPKWPNWRKKHVIIGTASDEDIDDEDDIDDERPVDLRVLHNVPPLVYHFDDQGDGIYDGHGVVPETVDTYAKEVIIATVDVPAVSGPSRGIHALGRTVIDLTGVDDNDNDSDKDDAENSNKKMKGKGKGPLATHEVIDLTGDDD